MLRFTTRDLLWVTALAAMGCGWWVDHYDAKQQIESAKDSEEVALHNKLTWRRQAHVQWQLYVHIQKQLDEALAKISDQNSN